MLDSEKFRRSKCYDGSFESNGHPGEHRQGGPPAPGPHRPGRGLLLRPSQRRTLLRAAPSWTGEPAYEDVRLIDTAAEAFGSRRWAAMMMLDNSRMLVGRK